MSSKPVFVHHLARLALCLSLAVGTGSALAQTYTKAQLQETYSSALSSEGFRPELTQAGNIKFRREARNYVIYVDEKDPTYFRLVLAFTADDKSPETRARRLEACNQATGEVKVVKAYLDSDGDPNFSAEIFLIVPGDAKTVVARMLRAIDSSYSKFTAKMGG